MKEEIFMKTTLRLFLLLITLMSYSFSGAQNNVKLQPYVNTLVEKGKEPISFVLDKLDHYKLILFDDALHTAFEPFNFYQELIKNPEFNKKVKYFNT